MNKQADKKRGCYIPPNGPKPPLFQPGDNCTMLMVEAVLKHEDRGRCKREWWYRVRCTCGTVEEVPQSSLKTKTRCRDCQNDARSQTLTRRVAVGGSRSGVPDFARMKLSN